MQQGSIVQWGLHSVVLSNNYISVGLIEYSEPDAGSLYTSGAAAAQIKTSALDLYSLTASFTCVLVSAVVARPSFRPKGSGPTVPARLSKNVTNYVLRAATAPEAG